MSELVCVGGPWHGSIVHDQGRGMQMHRNRSSVREFFKPTRLEIEQGRYEPAEVELAVGCLRLTGRFYRWHETSEADAAAAAVGLLVARAMMRGAHTALPAAVPR